MAGLILNLASLKSKADSAGVGTTATSSYPSLCPNYSSIPGYVTNGSSTVSISGSYASNLLVEDANVTVNRVVTGSGTVYRNISVGSSSVNASGDIPASGGSRYAYAPVYYEYTTRTYYSDNTYTDGSWTSASETIYGETISGSNLGTSETSRTYKGTSTPAGTVAGSYRTANGIDIYLEANVKSWNLYDETISGTLYIDITGGCESMEIDDATIKWTYASGSVSYTTYYYSEFTDYYRTHPEYYCEPAYPAPLGSTFYNYPVASVYFSYTIPGVGEVSSSHDVYLERPYR